jgi:hypothetical protein
MELAEPEIHLLLAPHRVAMEEMEMLNQHIKLKVEVAVLLRLGLLLRHQVVEMAAMELRHQYPVPQ